MYNHVTNVHMLNDGMAGLGWVPLKLDALVTEEAKHSHKRPNARDQ